MQAGHRKAAQLLFWVVGFGLDLLSLLVNDFLSLSLEGEVSMVSQSRMLLKHMSVSVPWSPHGVGGYMLHRQDRGVAAIQAVHVARSNQCACVSASVNQVAAQHCMYTGD